MRGCIRAHDAGASRSGQRGHGERVWCRDDGHRGGRARIGVACDGISVVCRCCKIKTVYTGINTREEWSRGSRSRGGGSGGGDVKSRASRVTSLHRRRRDRVTGMNNDRRRRR